MSSLFKKCPKNFIHPSIFYRLVYEKYVFVTELNLFMLDNLISCRSQIARRFSSFVFFFTFYFKKLRPEVRHIPLDLLTLPKHGSFAVLVKTSKCPVSLSCATDQTDRARISNRTASSEDRASGRKCHRPRERPPPTYYLAISWHVERRSPWMTYTQPL